MSTTPAEADDAQSDTVLKPSDVSFNAHAIAAAWEAADELPVCVAAAIATEFADVTVAAADGQAADHDVFFTDAKVHVEEKAVGVCARETAAQHAPQYIELDRQDGRVLAVNAAQIFENAPI